MWILWIHDPFSDSETRIWIFPQNTHPNMLYKVDYYSFKIFSRFWLAPIFRLILHNQLALPFLEDGSNIPSMVYSIRWYIRWYIRLDGINYNIPSINCFQAQPPSCLFPRRWKRKRRSPLSEDVLAEFLLTERKKCKNKQNQLRLSTFRGVFARKKHLFIS